VIFISILAGKLPPEQQARARTIGLSLALIMRVLLLLSISWIASLTYPLFTVPAVGQEVSGRDLILLGGGLFLIAKATYEIHERLEGEEHHSTARATVSFTSVIIQILLLDIVFSLDSVITAVGLAEEVSIMILAVVIAIAVMLVSAGAISNFVNKHPTVKMLALSFLLLIGFSLVVEGLHFHIPKGYIYFAMGFSVLVEVLNLRVSANRKKAKQEPINPVTLRQPPYLARSEERASIS
jgi:predicted tellurium resistance membrane protein TerC